MLVRLMVACIMKFSTLGGTEPYKSMLCVTLRKILNSCCSVVNLLPIQNFRAWEGFLVIYRPLLIERSLRSRKRSILNLLIIIIFINCN